MTAITSSATTTQPSTKPGRSSETLSSGNGKSVKLTKVAALLEACINIASSKLPRVLLKTHVMTTGLWPFSEQR